MREDEWSSAQVDGPPTYDDAVSSRITSFLTPHQDNAGGSDLDEREGLLQPRPITSRTTDHGGRYEPPSVESVRSSVERPYASAAESPRGSSLDSGSARLSILDFLDAPVDNASANTTGFRGQFSKQLTVISSTLSTIQRRLSVRWPSMVALRPRVPQACNVVAWMSGMLLTVFLTSAVLAILIFYYDGRPVSTGRQFDPESVREFLRDHVNADRIRGFAKHLTAFDHVAGTQGDYTLAQYVKAHFDTASLHEVEVKE